MLNQKSGSAPAPQVAERSSAAEKMRPSFSREISGSLTAAAKRLLLSKFHFLPVPFRACRAESPRISRSSSITIIRTRMTTKPTQSTKRVLAVHDLCSFGRCSLTAAIPVISAMGIQVCPFPTAWFSNNLTYGTFHFTDFTAGMTAFMEKWESLGLHYDAIYSGFLAVTDTHSPCLVTSSSSSPAFSFLLSPSS